MEIKWSCLVLFRVLTAIGGEKNLCERFHDIHFASVFHQYSVLVNSPEITEGFTLAWVHFYNN